MCLIGASCVESYYSVIPQIDLLQSVYMSSAKPTSGRPKPQPSFVYFDPFDSARLGVVVFCLNDPQELIFSPG